MSVWCKSWLLWVHGRAPVDGGPCGLVRVIRGKVIRDHAATWASLCRLERLINGYVDRGDVELRAVANGYSARSLWG